jgi:hypothetical protein
MNSIDSGYDDILGSNYELCKINFQELKTLVKSWYPNTDFKEFDNRFVREEYERGFVELKKAGLITNYFYAYKENDQYYLLDGFNRLLTDYGQLDFNPTVFVKVLTTKLPDNDLMRIMFHLNMWKLQGDGHHNFKPNDFFDRGFRLLLNKKFGISFYSYSDYDKRTRDRNDFNVLHYFFRNEQDFCEAFAFSFTGLRKLLENPNIIGDLKELLKANDYLEKPFKNYDMFVNGYAMFLSWRRVIGDNSEHKFETYLEKLKNDSKFFKKLQGMSGNESTRKNIYEFFRAPYKKPEEKKEPFKL